MKTNTLARTGGALVLLFGIGSSFAACSDDHHHEEGTPTGSVCPATQTLTYANFGQAFFATYCQTCHASTVTGAARKGAPSDHVFDGVDDIQLLAEHIDEHAAAGPDAVNTVMPPED